LYKTGGCLKNLKNRQRFYVVLLNNMAEIFYPTNGGQ
jgi:hypothetical protein